MSFFNEFNTYTDEYFADRDVTKLVGKLEDLLTRINNSVDDALYTNSHKELKKSINDILINMSA